MIRYTLLRALDPDASYPKKLFGLSLNGVPYDLPLPDSIGDALAAILSPRGPFTRIDHLSNRAGIHSFCVNSKRYDTEPCYAESELRLETNNGSLLMGSLLQHAAASKLTAAEIVRFALDESLSAATQSDGPIEAGLSSELTEWILQHSKFLQHCGGFELMRATYYFKTSAEETSNSSVDRGKACLPEARFSKKADRLKLFRAMLSTVPG